MKFKCNQVIDCKQGSIRAVRYNVDGNYCITCGVDKKLKLWNPQKKILLKTYEGHASDVLDASSSGDSGFILSASGDKSVIYWDVSTGQVLKRYRGHLAPVTCVNFNEESTLAISGSQDNRVMCWDLKSRNLEPIQTLTDAQDCITCLKVVQHKIVTSSIDGKVRVYDLRKANMVSDYLGESITYVNLTKDGQCILASCADGVIRLIDIDTGQLLNEFEGHSTKDFKIESIISYRDDHILSGSSDGYVYVWDLISSKIKNKIKHEKLIKTQSDIINSISGHPNKDEFLSSCSNFVYLWSLSEEIIESD